MSSRDYDLQAQLGYGLHAHGASELPRDLEPDDPVCLCRKGSQGVVWRARRKADGALVAIKQMFCKSRREQSDAAQEVRVLAKMQHPHIIKYLGSFREGTVLNIVTELAESGSLYDLIKKRKASGAALPENQVWKYFLQTALGLQHIHSHRILHRDVKTMNIFLTRKDEVKVGDLGVAKVLSNTMDMASTMVGTPYYLSPELCEGKPYNDKSDVWSLGCVLYELCTMRHPFDAQNQGALIIKIIRGKYPALSSSFSSPLAQLLDACLERDTRRRPDATQLLALPQVKEQAAALGIRLLPSDGHKRVSHREHENEILQQNRGEKHGPAVEKRPHVDVETGSKHVFRPSARQNQRPLVDYKAAAREGEHRAGGGFIPAGPSARDGGVNSANRVAGGGGLAKFLRPAGVPSRPASAHPASAHPGARAFGGGGVIIAAGGLGAADNVRGAEGKARGGDRDNGGPNHQAVDGKREYAAARPGGPPRLFSKDLARGAKHRGRGDVKRPATAEPLRRNGGVDGAAGPVLAKAGQAGEGAGAVADFSRQMLLGGGIARRRPGMPAAVEEKIREKERARVAPPLLPGAAALKAIAVKATTPDQVLSGENEELGGGSVGRVAAPTFFPPSVPVPRSHHRARPTIDDLVRQEVKDLPEQCKSKDGTGKMEMSGMEEAAARKASEGHDDLLAWFREQVVVEPAARGDARENDNDDRWAVRARVENQRAEDKLAPEKGAVALSEGSVTEGLVVSACGENGEQQRRASDSLEDDLGENEEERRQELLRVLQERNLLHPSKARMSSRDTGAMHDSDDGAGSVGEAGDVDEERGTESTLSGGEFEDETEDDGVWGHPSTQAGLLGQGVGSGVMDAISGPCRSGEVWELAQCAEQVGWRVSSPDRSSPVEQDAGSMTWTSETIGSQSSGSDAETMDEEGKPAQEATASLAHAKETEEDAKVRQGQTEDEREERQRGKLLFAALEEARGVLTAALGETKFATLHAAVMEEGDGVEANESWGADRHGWQMLQYIYLETETKKIYEKYGAL